MIRTTAANISSTAQRKQKRRRATMSSPGPRKSPRGPRNSSRVVTVNTTPPKVVAAATITKTKKYINGNKRKRTQRHGDEENDDDNYYDNEKDPDSENDDDSDNDSVVVTDTTLTKRKKSVLNKFEAQWNEMYGRLLQYKNKNHGSTSVPRKFDDDPGLGDWVKNQRRGNSTRNKNRKITTERKERLNSIGFVWNPHEALWEEMFNRLIEYKKQFKHTCVPKADLVLGQWVQKQRVKYHTKHLTKEKIKFLEDLGFQWTPRKDKEDAIWNQRFEELRNYVEQHDGQLPSASSLCKPKLVKWVYCQREAKIRAMHTEERKAKLRSISSGFYY